MRAITPSILYLLILALTAVSTVQAQNKRTVADDQFLQLSTDVATTEYRHATLELMQSPEGRQALARYHDLKEKGLLPLSRKGAGYEIGQLKVFSVRNLANQNNNAQYDDIQFTKKFESTLFDIWVETAEISNGNVTDADVQLMADAINAQTPAGSYNPQAGVIVNEQAIFGPPPDVDGDGKVDVLVLDIRDGYVPGQGGGFTLGFFDPINLSGQNMADIIHLDSFPGITDQSGQKYQFGRPEQTFAHEYQHLIFSTVNQGFDFAFVNEGLSVWAEVVNGFVPPITGPPLYYQVPVEWRRPLLDWREGGGPALQDYQRGGLFTAYLADRIGVLEAGAVARDIGIGPVAYQHVLDPMGLALQDVITDFHIANLVNDRSIDPAYGYASPLYGAFRINTVPTIDGTASTSTPKTTGGISQGGVHYVIWERVADMQLLVQEDNGRADLINPRLILETETDPPSVVPLSPGSEGTFLAGDYTRVTLVIPHVDVMGWDPDLPIDNTPPTVNYSYSAQWQSFQSSVQEVAYENGTAAEYSVGGQGPFQAVALAPTSMKANRFTVPPNSRLSAVRIDHPYANNFDPSIPITAPTDFTLVIWDEGPDGLPGNELFTLDVTDESVWIFPEIVFHTVDLSAFATEMSALPPVIFVGTRNVGTDNNIMAMSIAELSPAGSPSVFFDPAFGPGAGAWASFDNVCIGTPCVVDFSNYVLPIRAVFSESTVTAVEGPETELPDRITLEQNYPNPFNPSTTIRFTLPTAGPVALRVFDLLGRQIDTLVDGVLASGQHEVQFDASSLASGLYIYSLESQEASLTRTMTVLK